MLVLVFALLTPASKPKPPPPLPPAETTETEQVLTPSPQRSGDPDRGYDALVNGGYMTCGLPWDLYKRSIGTTVSPLEGRTGLNVKLPLELSATKNADGVTVVAPNCLGCHASTLNGRIVIGLGDVNVDMTQDLKPMAWGAQFFTRSDKDGKAWREWYRVLSATQRYTELDTIGVHSADNLAIALAAHRDPKTLAWSDHESFAPPRFIVPTDIPAWWLLKKKAAMFQTGIGRGDQARMMMSSSLYCTDDVKEAERIDRMFVDVRAYLMTLDAPKYPGRIDAKLAREGRDVFEGHCADCHGTYAGHGGKGDTYPNKVIALEEIGTDPMLARGSQADANGLVDWFNGSFYGERAQLVPTRGYVAPPLDGVWATAPYFHNGSVPTLEGVVDSSKRPRFWRRDGGRTFTAIRHGKDGAEDSHERKRIYDTREPGYANTGHTYGDELSPEERHAVLEYLKTL